MKKKEICFCKPIKQGKEIYPELNSGETVIRHAPLCRLGIVVAVPDGKFPSELAQSISIALSNKD